MGRRRVGSSGLLYWVPVPVFIGAYAEPTTVDVVGAAPLAAGGVLALAGPVGGVGCPGGLTPWRSRPPDAKGTRRYANPR